MTAQEFVDGVNEEGVKLRLGEPLLTDDSSKELFAVELEQVAKLPGSQASHTGGSLSVSEDSAGAENEMT
ncbi:MAG: hypothetical protein H0V15_05505, partial [Solirubrobacterales bacterium]|nr:hypothetical protein [Solirubrobacterales bacterium]